MAEDVAKAHEWHEKGKILVVDDNATNLELLSSILVGRGYGVKAAVSGKRALALISGFQPDLIMLDINMPEMDGYECCAQLKANPETSRIPVIFLSALDQPMDKVKAFKVGGVDYITKPFHFMEVLARIETHLKIARLQREMERKNAELAKKNEDLIQANSRADRIFSLLSDVLPGTVLDGKYRLEQKVGTGGFGTVYQAVHTNLNRPVAVKIFQPPPGTKPEEELERFRLEGISACRVNHPNAISVLDSGVSPEGIAYLVMELLEGHTLFQELKEKRFLTPDRCSQIILPICEVLQVAHAAGIVHRDIKPENIFLHTTSEGEEVVKLLDFGIAKLLGDSGGSEGPALTMGKIVGTPLYMSPERLNNKPYDGRADIYSLGVLLYRLLTGHLPFESPEGDVMAVAVMHITMEPPPLHHFNSLAPKELEPVIWRALRKNPEHRSTAAELAADFRMALTRIDEKTKVPPAGISLPAVVEVATLVSDTGKLKKGS
ncbi:MAG: protein kinase [Blastocatellia bacterium]|nr:protein kinase [Blastocatellia bacterium]